MTKLRRICEAFMTILRFFENLAPGIQASPMHFICLGHKAS